ncbi:efflux RND transporter periplasmic adaptor subunit [Oleiharenicola lentus]|uniref:efflux RND transporter periplasmic adaptor subunit n=1 Tax=Oleiharenicola lentus TaxID=2508720 RepID=UPI003F677460
MNAPSSLRRLLLLSALTPALFAQNTPLTVRTVAPKKVSEAAAYTIPGRTEPFEAARVFTRATGIISERTLDIGDIVKAGDVLAVVSAPDLDRAVEAARASVEQAQVRAANSKNLADRSTSLLDARAVSKEESDQRVSDAAAGSAAVRVAQAELARLEEQQKFATVRAPFDAVIAARNFDRGDRVRGDSATSEGWLFHLVKIDKLRFTVFAAPDLALRLTAESSAQVRFGEFPGRIFSAKVARSSRIFDPISGTMRVELIIENPDLTLPAGLTGNATFNVVPSAGTFLVPTNTVLTQAGQTRIAVVKDGKIALIDVALGRNLGAQVEVTSATLAPDAAVIINPNSLLRSGDAVTIAPPATATRS